MRILYFLEPMLEQDKPYLRVPTIRNHLRHEFSSLARQGATISLIAAEPVVREAKRLNLIEDNVAVYPIPQNRIRAVAKTAHLYYSLSDSECSLKLKDLIGEFVDHFGPDLLIAYETLSSTPLRSAFPQLRIIDSTLGYLSREPYPETFSLDPFGSGKHAFPNRQPAEFYDEFKNLELIPTIRQTYQSLIAQHSPVTSKDIRRSDRPTILLPLQVSPYFTFDQCLNADLEGATQLEFMVNVLERVGERVDVLVTEHGSQRVLNKENVRWLRTNFANFRYYEPSTQIRWFSQFALPLIDGVISVSSSVAYQAVLYEKPVHIMGTSQLSFLDEKRDIGAFLDSLGQKVNQDEKLHFLASHYSPMTQRHLYSGLWYGEFLKSVIGSPIGGFSFSPIEPDERLIAAYRNGARPISSQPKSVAAKVGITSILAKFRKKAGHTSKREPQTDVSPGVAALEKAIEKAEVVSFDLFDTLVGRRIADHRLVFELVPRTIALIDSTIAGKVDQTMFVAQRREAGRIAHSKARDAGEEDTTLTQIYVEFCKLTGLPVTAAEALADAEYAAEKQTTYPRRDMIKLFRYALDMRKRVFIVSDIYIDRKYIEDLLDHYSIRRYEKLFVSSDYKLLKKTGRLFDAVIRYSDVDPRDILHIGDNWHSDIDRAKSRGIRALQVPVAHKRLQKNPGYKRLTDSPGVLASLTAGAIASRHFDGLSKEYRVRSIFAGNPKTFGYAAAGPIILNFTMWIAEQAKARGIRKLFFLSRDGRYPFEIYNLLRASNPDLPEAHYLYASRRACNAAAISSVPDLLDSLAMAFSEVPLDEFIRSRLGIEISTQRGALKQAGFTAPTDVVSSKDSASLEKIECLFNLVGPQIVEALSDERRCYASYLHHLGFGDVEAAVVDIGHNGTLQDALIRLSGRKVHGLYYSTFDKAASVANAHDVNIIGHLLNYEKQANSHHYYVRNIGMFEFLFLPPEKSLERVIQAGDEFLPKYVERPEDRRIAVAQEVRAGILAFAHDVLSSVQGPADDLIMDPEDAASTFKFYLESPSEKDLAIVQGVYFADMFGGRAERYLIASDAVGRHDKGEALKMSWWKAGARAHYAGRGRRSDIVRTVRRILNRST